VVFFSGVFPARGRPFCDKGGKVVGRVGGGGEGACLGGLVRSGPAHVLYGREERYIKVGVSWGVRGGWKGRGLAQSTALYIHLGGLTLILARGKRMETDAGRPAHLAGRVRAQQKEQPD